MQNTTAKLLFLLIVTGALFVGCDRKDAVTTTTTGGSLDQSVLTGLDDNDDDWDEDEDEGFESEDDDYVPQSTTPATSTTTPTTTTQNATYKDGTYSSTSSYNTPAGVQKMGVTLSLKDGVIQSVSIDELATVQTCMMYQQVFNQGINSLVVGKSLASLGSIGAVNGASLTPNGFNSSVTAIRAQAAI
jgi:hypothetical protein